MRAEETKSRPLAKRLRQDMTKAETVLWTRLKERQVNGWRFRRQHPVGPYVADFACLEAGLIIEVDGATHCEAIEIHHDRKRAAFLKQKGWTILRVSNLDVYDNLDGVVRAVELALAPLGPSGHSPRKRGETSDRPSPPFSGACVGDVSVADGGGSLDTDFT